MITSSKFFPHKKKSNQFKDQARGSINFLINNVWDILLSVPLIANIFNNSRKVWENNIAQIDLNRPIRWLFQFVYNITQILSYYYNLYIFKHNYIYLSIRYIEFSLFPNASLMKIQLIWKHVKLFTMLIFILFSNIEKSFGSLPQILKKYSKKVLETNDFCILEVFIQSHL